MVTLTVHIRPPSDVSKSLPSPCEPNHKRRVGQASKEEQTGFLHRYRRLKVNQVYDVCGGTGSDDFTESLTRSSVVW